ncbi:MAG: PD40 domain-containing protein [Chitinophagaceae bacterium]|nr:PD40 domain-containing protein [Chitinophagaceae bacterium]
MMLTLNSVAQKSSDSLRQFKYAFNVCDELLKKGKLEKAILCYEDFITLYPDSSKGYIRLAELNYHAKDKNKALYYANKAIDLNANEAYAPMSFLANKMTNNNDDATAILIMNRLSVSELDTARLVKVQENKLRYNLRNKAEITSVGGLNLRNLGDSINSAEDEYLPSISLDGQQIVFTRRVGGANEDFFSALKDSNGHWRKAKNMGTPPNTSMPDGAAMLSADGYYLFYTRCDMRSPNGIESGGCDLVFSYREDSVWSSPQYFGFTINTPGYEGQPCLSSDNKDLYFVSNREGGYGGMDIWVSHFVNQFWSKPENLGPTINTPKNEISPFIHPDNETLYFSSDGPIGLGKTDLYMSRKNASGNWKQPVHLAAPLNTEGFDGSIIVNAKGTKGYIASSRKEGKGGMDIYEFDLYPAIKPIPTICIKGYLLDKFYKNHIYDRTIQFLNPFNQKVIGSQQSNEGDGSYAQALQMGKTYLLKVVEPGYRPFYKIFKLNNDSIPENLYFNIKLKQPGFRDTLYKNWLHIDSSGLALDSISLHELDSLTNTWATWKEDSADVIVFINNYYYGGDSLTDTSFAAYLQTAVDRQQLVYEFLHKKGIRCEWIMRDLNMILKRDDEEPFKRIEMSVVEFY